MYTFKKAAFYIVAHADDWQLFMSPDISRDIANKECKVVIIHTTAGDAGKDEKYWKAREKAALDSLLFRTSVDERHYREENEFADNDKKIFTATVNNCVCYFLRLPDGAYDGNGFPAYRHQSLEKFRSGAISQLTSLDNRSVYACWEDLTHTIDRVIANELTGPGTGALTEVMINIPDNDPVLNPWDHNDHLNTSLLVQNTEACKVYPRQVFLDYQVINGTNLPVDEDLFWKIGMFAVYHQSLYKEYGHSTISEDQKMIPWCFKNNSYRRL